MFASKINLLLGDEGEDDGYGSVERSLKTITLVSLSPPHTTVWHMHATEGHREIATL